MRLTYSRIQWRFILAKLIYSAITSLDGYVADEHGNFDWAMPDSEVHAFINDLERPIGTYLYGRRMYDVMSVWETMPTSGDAHPVEQDFARLWQMADKIVFSRSLEKASTAKTRIERAFDPREIRQLKSNAERDISVGGPDLAGEAIKAGQVDEYVQFVTPIMVGGGNHWLPKHVRVQLELLEERRFKSGVVYLRYRTKM
jgi:dihydrofolate reductase